MRLNTNDRDRKLEIHLYNEYSVGRSAFTYGSFSLEDSAATEVPEPNTLEMAYIIMGVFDQYFPVNNAENQTLLARSSRILTMNTPEPSQPS